MKQPNAGEQRLAAIVHGAITVSALTVQAVGFGIGPVVGVPLIDLPVTVPATPVALAIAVLGLVSGGVIRRSMGLPEGPSDPARWWATNLRSGITLWALGEGLAVLGAVGYLLTGDYVAGGVLGGAGLVMLIGYRPARLAQG